MNYYRIVAVAFLAAALCAACDKREEKSNQGLPPADQWQAPAQTPQGGAATPANPHAAPPGMTGGSHGGMQGNPHGGAAMQGNPHGGAMQGNPHGGGAAAGSSVENMGLQPPDPNREIDADNHLRGSIKPTEETKVGIPKGAVVFISVKRADPKTGQPVGSPLAVKRLRLTDWPLWFSLTDEDAMIMGTSLGGDVVITAWADQDQDAITKSPGDVMGTVRATVPAKDLVLTLDQVLK